VIVISDNSALSALAETGLLALLPRLFGEVCIPEAVRSECGHPRAPQVLREWISHPPDWLRIVPDPAERLLETLGLGSGEAAAITLAWVNRKSSKLILDEKRGRRVAETLGLPMTGIVGIIGEAAECKWLDFDETIASIRQTGFHLSDSVVAVVRRKQTKARTLTVEERPDFREPRLTSALAPRQAGSPSSDSTSVLSSCSRS